MKPEHKAWIDNASAVELLRKWRFAELGDPMFQDYETTEYYQNMMNAKIATYAPGYVSKRVGW